jgi:hypothetical protein
MVPEASASWAQNTVIGSSCCDRHERRDDVEHDDELGGLRRLGDGVVQTAAVEVDIILVASSSDVANHGGAVHVGEQEGVTNILVRQASPTPRPQKGCS